MKLARSFAMIFAVVGIVLMLGTTAVCLLSLDATVEMVGTPKEAIARSEEMMEALAQGDFSAAADVMYGQPDLGADQGPEDALSALVWDAFVDSISYEFVGVCYAEDSGIYRDAAITALDIPAVTENLQTRVHAVLTARMEAAEDMAELYDENGAFRGELTEQVLSQAVEQAIEEDGVLVTRDVTLKLIHRDGQWWVVPDQALLQAISGGVA